MKVIVTGGCGYIGSHVARAFKQNGDEVLIIDRVLREHTLKDIDGYYIGDFSNDDSLATMVDYLPDVLVHCAGTSLVGPSMVDPSEYYNNNVALCVICQYSCLTCTSGTAITCSTCDATNHRTYLSSNNSCPCDAGFYDNSVGMCVACDYTCATCTGPSAS